MHRTKFTWQVTEVGSVTVACIIKSVNHQIYSCKVSLADWDLEWIHVAAFIFAATALNT